MNPLDLVPTFFDWMHGLLPIHDALEEARDQVRALTEPPSDLSLVAQGLDAATRTLLTAFLGSREPAVVLGDTAAIMQQTLTELAKFGDEPRLELAHQALGRASRHLEPIRMALAGVLAVELPNHTSIRASHELPSLFVFDRPVVVHELTVHPPPATELTSVKRPPPPIGSFEELDATLAALLAELTGRASSSKKQSPPLPKDTEPATSPPGFIADPLPTLSLDQFRCQRAREVFEEIAMLGQNRVPLLGDPWRGSRTFEQRLLQNLDAFVALGPRALAELPALGPGALLPSPSQLFATTLIAGCVHGRDLLALAEQAHRLQAPEDPAFTRAFSNALRLVNHPLVVPIARGWLRHSSAVMRALGVEVLAHRESITDEELCEAAFDEPEVVKIALPLFALGAHPRRREALQRGQTLAEQLPLEAGLFRAVALSLSYANHPDTVRFVKARIPGPLAAIAAQILALSAGAADAEWLLAQIAEAPDPGLVQALGWAGPSEAIRVCLALLSDPDAGVVLMAADALERITGAGFFEIAAEAPESLAPPELPDPKGVESETAERGEADRDPAPEGAPDLLERPSTDRARWEAFIAERGEWFLPERRYRRGHAYTPLVSLSELDSGRCLPAERRWLVAELAIRTGQLINLDPEDFVVTQERALSAFRPTAEATSRSPGGWERAFRGL